MVAVESPAPRLGESYGPVVLGVHVDAGAEVVPIVHAVVIVPVLDRVNVPAHFLGRVDHI
jgi:hypothetical protein